MTTEEVLYVVGSGSGIDIYYIFSLTYSTDNPERFPKYKEFKERLERYAVQEVID